MSNISLFLILAGLLTFACKSKVQEPIPPATKSANTQAKVEVIDLTSTPTKVPGIPKDFDINTDGSITILSFSNQGHLSWLENSGVRSIAVEAPLGPDVYNRLLVDSENNVFIYQNADQKFSDYVKYGSDKKFTIYQRSPEWMIASNKQKYPNTIVSEQKYFTIFQFSSKSKKGFLGGKFDLRNPDDLSGFVEINSSGQNLITNYTKITRLDNEGLGYPRYVKEDADANIWATYSTNFGNTHYLVKYGRGSASNKIVKLNTNGDEIPIFFPLPDDDALVFSNHSSKTSLMYVNSTSEIKKVKDLGEYETIQDPVLDKEGYLWYFNSSTVEIIGINKTGQVKSISLSEYIPQAADSNRLYYINYVFRCDEVRGLFYVMFSSNNTSSKSILCKVKK